MHFFGWICLANILSRIVSLDSQDPSLGKKKKLGSVFDFACGSGSLILNMRQKGNVGHMRQCYLQRQVNKDDTVCLNRRMK
jgi:type I restriction enzyme M protein